MADIEYSSNYGIYLTKNGVRFLTNPSSISIMNLLSTSAHTATDISQILNISKSSVQSNMSKLLRIGFVTTYNDESDGRKVLYIPASVKVLDGVESQINVTEIEKEIIEKIMTDDNLQKNTIELANITMVKYGIDINPLIERLGSLLTQYIIDKMNIDNFDTTINSIKIAAKSLGADEFNIDIDEDITVELTVKNDKSAAIPICSIISGMVCKAASVFRKKPYVIKSKSFDGKNKHTTVITKYNGFIRSNSIINKLNDGLTDITSKDHWPFAIYTIDGKSFLFGNDTQISMLRALEKGDMTLKEMSEELNILPVTIHVNMAKLLNINAVAAKGDTKMKNTAYSLYARPIVTSEECDKTAEKSVKALFDTINLDEPLFKIALGYIFWAFRATGVGIKNIMRFVGNDIGAELYKRHPDKTAEEMIDYSCNVDVLETAVNLVSRIPLVFSTDDRHSELDMKFMMPFFAGVAKTALKLYTGHDYPVTFKNKNCSLKYD